MDANLNILYVYRDKTQIWSTPMGKLNYGSTTVLNLVGRGKDNYINSNQDNPVHSDTPIILQCYCET